MLRMFVLQSKDMWLTSWPVADDLSSGGEDDLANVIEAADDTGLVDLLDAPPTHDAANQSVAAPFPQPLPPVAFGVTRGKVQGMMQQILDA
ncbi:hypothetical protein FN846DRAFT_902452 [Sphaerosporella brunnea]|uniref:Uncharacterized protein n=1 Tax=Sphaerosporella brunnea TaxID=1250544 RepID=A0A5J5FAC7_9PEZI|nr:hypothetical protein FN846DRAFT_902452 [Sphaerosporella brunnea]